MDFEEEEEEEKLETPYELAARSLDQTIERLRKEAEENGR